MLERKEFHSDAKPGASMVLYVEDDATNHLTLRMLLLGRSDVVLLEATGGDDALEVLESEETWPDLILMDNTLLNETGAQAIEKIRQACGDIFPFLICSALDAESADRIAKDTRSQGTLCKPVNKAALHKAIAKWSKDRVGGAADTSSTSASPAPPTSPRTAPPAHPASPGSSRSSVIKAALSAQRTQLRGSGPGSAAPASALLHKAQQLIRTSQTENRRQSTSEQSASLANMTAPACMLELPGLLSKSPMNGSRPVKSDEVVSMKACKTASSAPPAVARPASHAAPAAAPIATSGESAPKCAMAQDTGDQQTVAPSTAALSSSTNNCMTSPVEAACAPGAQAGLQAPPHLPSWSAALTKLGPRPGQAPPLSTIPSYDSSLSDSDRNNSRSISFTGDMPPIALPSLSLAIDPPFCSHSSHLSAGTAAQSQLANEADLSAQHQQSSEMQLVASLEFAASSDSSRGINEPAPKQDVKLGTAATGWESEQQSTADTTLDVLPKQAPALPRAEMTAHSVSTHSKAATSSPARSTKLEPCKWDVPAMKGASSVRSSHDSQSGTSPSSPDTSTSTGSMVRGTSVTFSSYSNVRVFSPISGRVLMRDSVKQNGLAAGGGHSGGHHVGRAGSVSSQPSLDAVLEVQSETPMSSASCKALSQVGSRSSPDGATAAAAVTGPPSRTVTAAQEAQLRSSRPALGETRKALKALLSKSGRPASTCSPVPSVDLSPVASESSAAPKSSREDPTQKPPPPPSPQPSVPVKPAVTQTVASQLCTTGAAAKVPDSSMQRPRSAAAVPLIKAACREAAPQTMPGSMRSGRLAAPAQSANAAFGAHAMTKQPSQQRAHPAQNGFVVAPEDASALVADLEEHLRDLSAVADGLTASLDEWTRLAESMDRRYAARSA